MEKLLGDGELRDFLIDRLDAFDKFHDPLRLDPEEVEKIANTIVRSIRKASISVVKRTFEYKKKLDDIRDKLLGKTHVDHVPISFELVKQFESYDPRIVLHTENGIEFLAKDGLHPPEYPCYRVLCEMWHNGNRSDVALCYSGTVGERKVVVPVELGYFPLRKIRDYLLSPIESCWEFWSHVPEVGKDKQEYFVFKNIDTTILNNHPFLKIIEGRNQR